MEKALPIECGRVIPAKTLVDLEWRAISEALADRCHSEMARERALNLPFLNREQAIRHSLSVLTELRNLLAEEDAPPPWPLVSDVQAALKRSRKGGILEPSDLRDISQIVSSASRVHGYFKSRYGRCPQMGQFIEDLPVLPEVAQEIDEAIEPDGTVADEASARLGDLRRRAKHIHQSSKQKVVSMVKSKEYEDHLQDTYYTIREGRYVLPVKAQFKNVVGGIIHHSSQSGATVFLEPNELVEMNNQLKLAVAEVEEEVRRILSRLTLLVMEHWQEILKQYEVLLDYDLLRAKALLSADLDASQPVLSEEDRVHLIEARHPLLALMGDRVVSNELVLGGPLKALVISGPNTGGKTVALKTYGLCALMLLAGLHIPADPNSEIPIYESIFTDIGDEQSVATSLSTFSGHLSNIMKGLKGTGPGRLVLLDELVVGTDPSQGSALAEAILTAFIDGGASLVVTTHYERLKALSLEDERIQNASVGYNESSLQPNFKLTMGIPGRSSALEIAEQLGMERAVVDHARSLIDQGERRFDEIIGRLNRKMEAAEQEAERLRERQRQVVDLQGQYERRLEELQRRRHRAAQEVKAEILADLNADLETVRTVVRDLQRGARPRKAQQARQWVGELIEQAGARIEGMIPLPESLQEEKQGERNPIGPAQAIPGQKVLVCSSGLEGVIDEPPDKRGRVTVRVGNIKTAVDLAELDWPAKATKTPERAVPMRDQSVMRTPDNTLDLRGFRVEQALIATESALDRALGENRSVLYLIHGYGTGALRKSLREFLDTSPYVDQHRPGEKGEGGDGITVILLK